MENTDLHAQLAQLAGQITDPETLKRHIKALQKVVDGEADDLAKLPQLREEQKLLKLELEKVYEIISFHLGSPLNSLVILSNMLLKDAINNPLPHPVAQLIQHLDTHVEKLHESMANLMYWADLSVKNFNFQPKTLDLQKVVNKAFAQAENTALRKRVNLHLGISGNLTATFDEKMMLRVLLNLLSNAIKFTPTDAQVRMDVQETELGISVAISDTGIGMGSAKLANVFTPSRKNTQRGTANEMGLGMGLIVAKGLLELHQVPLVLESTQGQGTKATFLLPTIKE